MSEMGDDEVLADLERRLQREWVKVMNRSDVQEFEQVQAAGGHGVRVWYRTFGFDFMASAKVKAGKVYRELRAVGESRERALERLAAHVLEWHHPSGDFRTKGEARMFFERTEPGSDPHDWEASHDR